MIRRLSSFFLVVAVLCSCMTVTAQAAQDSGWTELLESTSVQTNGTNTFTVSGTTGAVTIPLYAKTRLRKIDMLIWNPSGQRFSAASVTASGTTTNLDVYGIGGNLTRVVGYVPSALYSSITVNFTKGTTSSQTYEVLSCKVTALGVQEFVAEAEVYLDAWGVTDYFTTNYNIPFWWDQYGEVPVIYEWLARVHVYDWQKYDTLSIWGSATSASIESIRVSIGTTALDFEVNYIDVEGQDSQIYGDILVTPELGKYLFNVTVDLTGVDRTLADPMYIYFTGSFNSMVQAYFNCQYVNGAVATADTTEITWWNRFTAFMTNLFNGNGTNTDEFEEDAAQQGGEMGDLNDELENVTKPPIEDIKTDVDDYLDPADAQEAYAVFATLTGNSLVSSMLVMALTVALVAYVLYGKR